MGLRKKLATAAIPIGIGLSFLVGCQTPQAKTLETEIGTAYTSSEPFYIIGYLEDKELKKQKFGMYEYQFMIGDKTFRCYNDAEEMAELLKDANKITISLDRHDPEGKSFRIDLDNIESINGQKYHK